MEEEEWVNYIKHCTVSSVNKPFLESPFQIHVVALSEFKGKIAPIS